MPRELARELSRGAAAAGLAILLASSAAAGPLSAQCISRVTVDSSELRDRGAVGAADILDARMPQQLRTAFAGRIGCRSGLRLVVRLQTISLPSPFGNEHTATDSLKGESLLLDAPARWWRHTRSWPAPGRRRPAR
jgi:hypothetical protein